MSKPDWKDAPKWAQYLVLDCAGVWRWQVTNDEVMFVPWHPNAMNQAVEPRPANTEVEE
jgi:hypothetical protein